MRNFIFIFSLIITLASCGSSSSSSSNAQNSLPKLTFQEIHPENNGRLESKTISLDKWSWNQELSSNSELVEGIHYSVDKSMIPEGLTFEAVIQDSKKLSLFFEGNATNHHVNDSIDKIHFQLHPEIFLASSRKALDEEVSEYELNIIFGKGYKIAGEVEGLLGSVTLHHVEKNESIVIPVASSKFEFSDLVEPGEKYTIQIKKHPESQCCYLNFSEGYAEEKNLSNFLLNCNSPTWHASGRNENFANIAPAGLQPDYFSKFAENHFGDIAFTWSNSINMMDSPENYGKYFSLYNSSTDHFNFPQTNSFLDPHANILITDQNYFYQHVNRNLSLSNEKVLNAQWVQKVTNLAPRFTFNINYNYENYSMTNTLLDPLTPDTDSIVLIEFKGEKLTTWEENGSIRYKKIHSDLSQSPEIILSPTPEAAGYLSPTLNFKIDNKGNGIIVWVQDSHSGDLYMQTITEGSITTSDTLTIVSQRGNAYGTPAIDFNDHGDMILSWHEHNDENTISYLYKIEKIDGQWFFPNNQNDYLAQMEYKQFDSRNQINDNGTSFILTSTDVFYGGEFNDTDLRVFTKYDGIWSLSKHLVGHPNVENLLIKEASYDIHLNEDDEILLAFLSRKYEYDNQNPDFELAIRVGIEFYSEGSWNSLNTHFYENIAQYSPYYADLRVLVFNQPSKKFVFWSSDVSELDEEFGCCNTFDKSFQTRSNNGIEWSDPEVFSFEEDEDDGNSYILYASKNTCGPMVFWEQNHSFGNRHTYLNQYK